MTIVGYIIVGLLLALFFWMVVSNYNEHPNTFTEKDDRNVSKNIGMMTGLQGGSIEDAAKAKFALNRAKGDAANADGRDIATATSMQINADLD